MTYLLTFGCYGRHLPGDVRGSTDRKRGIHRGRAIAASIALEKHARELMKQDPGGLNYAETFLVLETIQEVCAYRGWDLLAAHVRTSHAHVVLRTAADPMRAVADLKAYSTRRLNESGVRTIRWARGGNVVRLSSDTAVDNAIRYTVAHQGQPLALFVAVL